MRVFHPRSVHVRIAAGCNLGCVFCERENLPEASPGTGRRKRGTLTFTDGRNDLPIEKDMEAATWELVKEKLMPFTDHMELGGLGEPTLGKLFPKAASDIVAAGKTLFFFTNGHYLNLPRVLESVGDAPHISVSIDAGTPEAYERIRKGDLAKLIESVTAFREAKPNAIIDSQFTAIADNIDEIPRWVELCAKLGIGRTAHGEQLLLVGADHHATDRATQSVRFYKDRTLAALDEAVKIAQREGLWLMSRLPAFSELNPNAGEDGSDPRRLRRWADMMFFGANPCGGVTDTTDVTASLGLDTATAVDPGPPQAPRFMGIPAYEPEPGEEREVVTTTKELYVDYDGTVWSCLARHEIGDVRTGTWASIVEENQAYQEWLANWHYGTSNSNPTCKSCPRRK